MIVETKNLKYIEDSGKGLEYTLNTVESDHQAGEHFELSIGKDPVSKIIFSPAQSPEDTSDLRISIYANQLVESSNNRGEELDLLDQVQQIIETSFINFLTADNVLVRLRSSSLDLTSDIILEILKRCDFTREFHEVRIDTPAQCYSIDSLEEGPFFELTRLDGNVTTVLIQRAVPSEK